MDEIIPIDLDEMGELYAAMVYLAALAYPEDPLERDIFILAMKAHCIRYSKLQRRMTRAAGRAVTNSITSQKHRDRMELGGHRLERRLVMTEIVIPDFLEQLSTPVFRINDHGSLTRRIKEVPGDERENWRHLERTRQVLHLAMSLRGVMLGQPIYREIFVGKREWSQLLHAPEWVSPALLAAERYLQILKTLPMLQQTVLVRLVPGAGQLLN